MDTPLSPEWVQEWTLALHMDDKLIPFIEFTSEELQGEAYFSAWREALSTFFDAIPEDPDQLAGKTRVALLGEVMLFDTAFAPQRFRRDRKRILTYDNDHLVFQIYTRGSCQINNGEQQFVARAYSGILLDMGLSLSSSATDSHVYSLVIPRSYLALHITNVNCLAGQFNDHPDPKAAIIHQAIESVFASLPEIPAADGPIIGEGLVSLLATMFLKDRNPQASGPAVDNAIFDTICDHIETHLLHPEIGSSYLLQHFPLSRASLYRLFKPYGGVEVYIRDRRLARCLNAIRLPANNQRKLIDIATDWGFSSQASFSRAFRQRYGCAPSEVRDQAMAPAAQEDSSPADAYGEKGALAIQWWSRQLGRSGSQPLP